MSIGSAPPIRRIAVRAQQERHMIVLRRIANFERDGDARKEHIRDVRRHVEHQPIDAGGGRLAELSDAPVLAGYAAPHLVPAVALNEEVELHGNARGWNTLRRIQDVCADHTPPIFSRRSRVMASCSSAAISISPAASFAILRRANTSICSADLPVAQTI